MRVCLIAPAPNAAGASAHSPRALAALLARRHEVTLIHSGWGTERPPLPPEAGFREAYAELPAELDSLKFACEDHRHSAAAMEAIRSLYGDEGPDYLEAPDFRAHGLVPLQARRAGDPLLAGTTIATRISPTTELRNLHDGMLRQPGNQRLAELEREQLLLADRLLWPGGDCLALYRRYYDDLELPAAVRIRPPFELPLQEVGPPDPGERPLRLLFLGELRRSTGVFDLVEACQALPAESWSLTLAGSDTPTAAMGQSVREVIEVMSGEESRIEFDAALSPPVERLADADLLVVPARLEVSAGAALAAMTAGVPVLAAPVGDLAEVVEDGVSGWLAADVGPVALGHALRRLEVERSELERVRGSEAPRRRAEELSDPERTLDAYDDLLAVRRSVPPTPKGEPLVTGVVPYYRSSEYVAEAVASLLAQTHPRVEVLVVNDGSFDPADAVLEQLAAEERVRVVTQINRGEAAARTFGARVAAGEYVVMLDADNLLEPCFVERALDVLRPHPELVYATCWLRMIGPDGRDTTVHPGYAPVGNRVLSGYRENWDGDTLSMLPRRVFTELGFEYHPEGSMHSDWQLYRWMRQRGFYGAVIPERLARYRVVEESLIHSYPRELQDRSWSESRERPILQGVRWTAEMSG
ncbi:MAG TPA: glycosyltransferase [Solirubrobacterales bacterium]|nr:glycosyltransferase [Solirubrobacterales bacterium]